MIADSVEKIIRQVEEASGQILKSKEDFRLIVEAALSSQKIDELNELAFHAKFVFGLLSVIKKREAVVDEEYFKKVGEEFSQSYEIIRKLIQIILGNSSGFVKNIFSEKYFQLSQTSLQNLNKLCEDFAQLKLYLNDLKQKKDS
ncbi:MAG: hypothetical protein FD143_701 [Ignavibacteria bacterium]|nr:MAG: hypothetical protein FD143_701 [Ignavibacteria bacterium]KAF0161314.1 MAG: hypothetical protein FD188_902 [Ignavibacteria bacterium]